MSPSTFTVFLSLLLLSVPLTAAGSDTDPRITIRQEITSKLTTVAQERYEEGSVQVSVLPLDARIPVQRCAQYEVTPRGQHVHGRVHVSVRCAEPGRNFQIFMSADVEVAVPVLVTARALERAVPISPIDVTIEARPLTGTRGEPLLELPTGRPIATKRALPAGAILTLGLIKELPMVRKGERVQLISARRGMSITSSGFAMADGRLGQQIRVQNSNSKRTVTGWVSAPGVVSTQPRKI